MLGIQKKIIGPLALATALGCGAEPSSEREPTVLSKQLNRTEVNVDRFAALQQVRENLGIIVDALQSNVGPQNEPFLEGRETIAQSNAIKDLIGLRLKLANATTESDPKKGPEPEDRMRAKEILRQVATELKTISVQLQPDMPESTIPGLLVRSAGIIEERVLPTFGK